MISTVLICALAFLLAYWLVVMANIFINISHKKIASFALKKFKKNIDVVENNAIEEKLEAI